jgi:hypothetical protein
MKKHYGRYWVAKIGIDYFQSYFRQRCLRQTVCITVLPAVSNKETENSTPSLDNIVGGLFQETRNSKSPWVLLRDSICGDTISLSTTPSASTRKRKSRNNEYEDISNLSAGISLPINLPPAPSYWDSTEANNLFGTIRTVQNGVLETNAYEAITNQIALLLTCSEKHDGYLKILNTTGMEVIPKLSENQIFFIREKIRILNRCLQYANVFMEEKKNWGYCCEEAISDASTFGKFIVM